MSEKLADYVVGLGLKGQNVALLEINKAKKAGKELAKQKNKVNLSDVKAQNTAKKQLQLTKQQTQAIREQSGAAKSQEKSFDNLKNKARNVTQTGIGAASTAMTSGVTGLASSLPVVGSLFGAASSNIESAGREYIAGVTSNKNISLVRANYARAFQGAFSQGVENAASSADGVFTGRTGRNFFTSLADQGVSAQTVQGAIPALDKLAKSQGVGSIDELMGRLQSGTLKENAGLSKADIVLLQSQAQLLNNRFTSDVGAQMLTQTLQRLSPGMQRSASQLTSVTANTAEENRLRDLEENYSGEATGLFGGVAGMYRARREDRQLRADLQPLAQGVAGIQSNAYQRARRFVGNITSGNIMDFARQQVGLPAEPPANAAPNSGQVTGTLDTGNYEEDGPARPAAAVQADQLINEMLRTGRAISNTLLDINNQLTVTRAQMRRT